MAMGQHQTSSPLKQFLNGNKKNVFDDMYALALRYGDAFANLPVEQVTPLQKLLESDRPYAGGRIPRANNAMAELQRQLSERLAEAKALALRALAEQEGRLRATADTRS